MKSQTAICIPLHMCCLVAWKAAEAGTDAVSQQSEHLEVKSAVIVFEVFKLPKPGRAEVKGRVSVVVRSGHWIPLRNGTLLGEGAKLWMAPGARVVVRFSGSSSVDLGSTPHERWVVLQTDAAEQHDT